MKALFLLIALLRPAQANEEVVYKNDAVGMQFTHPKSWQESTNKKNETRILIPIEGSSERALLEISPVNFRSEKEIWQLSEVAINKTMKRDIERQWEEEILGVPVLMTKVNYSDKAGPRTSVTGLFYTLSPRKMMYRLTAAPDDFDKADFVWKQTIQSLRTADNSMPKPEDPTVKIALPDPKTKDDLPHPTDKHPLDDVKVVKAIVPPVAITAELGGKKVIVRLPGEWAADVKDGVLSLHNPNVTEPMTATLYSTLDSDPPASALFKASSASLNDFVQVNKRDESTPKVNRAGATVVQVWRSGTSSKGDLFTLEAYGAKGDLYFILAYRCETTSRIGASRKALEALLDQMSIEPAP